MLHPVRRNRIALYFRTMYTTSFLCIINHSMECVQTPSLMFLRASLLCLQPRVRSGFPASKFIRYTARKIRDQGNVLNTRNGNLHELCIIVDRDGLRFVRYGYIFGRHCRHMFKGGAQEGVSYISAVFICYVRCEFFYWDMIVNNVAFIFCINRVLGIFVSNTGSTRIEVNRVTAGPTTSIVVDWPPQ